MVWVSVISDQFCILSAQQDSAHTSWPQQSESHCTYFSAPILISPQINIHITTVSFSELQLFLGCLSLRRSAHRLLIAFLHFYKHKLQDCDGCNIVGIRWFLMENKLECSHTVSFSEHDRQQIGKRSQHPTFTNTLVSTKPLVMGLL